MVTAEQRQDEAASVKTKEVLLEIREEAAEDFRAVSAAHESAKENIKFIHGDQWDAAAKKARDGRPTLVFPKLTQYLDRVYGSMLQKRPAISVRADDQMASNTKARLASGKRVAMSNAMAGMMRQIDAINNAQIAYLYAYEMALAAGFGHWRYRADYKPYSFDKVITIDPIWDVFSVVWDQMSDDITNDDARRCLILTEMTKDAFEAQYPGATSATFTSDSGMAHMTDWVKGGVITVAERFTKRPKTYRLCELSDGRIVQWEDDDDAIKDELAQMGGIQVARERKHDGHEIAWVRVAGQDILDEEVIFPGETIPVVTCYGRLLKVDGKWVYRALHEHAKDEQRAYNYARTRAIEKVALSPLVPFIVGSSQIKGFETLWSTANTLPHAYLPYDDTHNPNRPSREHGETDLTGLRDMIQMSENGIMSATGQFEASMGRESNETSGRAVLARAQQSDQVASPFEENYHVALTKGGRIVADWIPRVYSTQSMAQILNEDGTEDGFAIGRQEIVDEQTGKTFILNDLSAGRYAIKIGTAPEFSTRRQEAIQGLTEFAQSFPGAAEVIASDILRNMDIPDAEKMAKKVESMLPPEIRQAGEQDDDQEIPPQAKAAIEQAQQVMQQAQEAVQAVQQETEAVVQERDALKAQLAAEKAAAEQAAAQSKLDRDAEMLGFEKRMFALEQKHATDKLAADKAIADMKQKAAVDAVKKEETADVD